MQAVSAQTVLLRKPSPAPNSVFNSVNRSCSGRDALHSATDFHLDDSVPASSNNCKDQFPPWRLCHSSLATHGGETHGSSKRDRDKKLNSLVYPRKSRGPDPLPARWYKQQSDVVHIPADEDLQKFYQRPKFTLKDFIVHFSANEDVPVGDVEKSLYSPLTYNKLQKVLEKQCRPRNTQLSTQQLQLPDDLPELRQRVPHKQLLIEMTAVIKEQLDKVVCWSHLPML